MAATQAGWVPGQTALAAYPSAQGQYPSGYPQQQGYPAQQGYPQQPNQSFPQPQPYSQQPQGYPQQPSYGSHGQQQSGQPSWQPTQQYPPAPGQQPYGARPPY